MIRKFLSALLSRAHNVVFYKILAIFIIAISIPVICVSALAIRHSTENIVYQVTQSSIESLSDKKSIIEQKMKEAENIVYQVFNNSVLSKLLRSVKPAEAPLLTSDMIKELNDIILVNELLHSIYIYVPDDNYVISDSKFELERFNDLYAIDLALEKSTNTVRRRLNRTDVITYTRNLKGITHMKNIIIIANINCAELFNIDPNTQPSAFDILIFDGKQTEILFNGDNLKTISSETISAIAESKEASGLYTIDGEQYFACSVYSGALDWTFVYLQPYTAIFQPASLIKKLIISSLIIVLMLSLVLAYIVSIFIYNPIGKLADKVSEQSAPDALKPGNAYKLIDEAIIKLFKNNTELMNKYQQVLPFAKQHTVNDFLSGEMFDSDKFKDILNLFGIRFVHAGFVNVVIDIETASLADKARELIDSVLSGFSNHMTYMIFNINKYRIAMIINTDMDQSQMRGVMETLKQNLNDKEVELTIAVGSIYTDISQVYTRHQDALALIRDKFFAGKNQIIFSRDKRQSGAEFAYDKKLEQELILCVTQSQDEANAVNTLDRLISKASGSFNSIEYIRYVYFQVVSRIIEAMNDIGFDLSKTDISSERVFETIQNSDTIGELMEFAVDIISSCVSQINEYKKAQHVVIADKVMDYLKSNYMRDISLSEVAGEVFLSPGYVNGMFKTVTGCTIYEYVTKIRMETASELLADGNMKIQDISARVGYNNIQSFFRLFKQHYRMTPAEYRRKLKGI